MVAFAVHGPLLLMQLPSNSFDANFHMFMAWHYAHHWFNPWNENALAGFSQTTYPPLTQQWIALFSRIVGLTPAYMLFQLIVVLLLPIAVFRYAKLWVDERAASYAALGSVFLGSLCMLVYQDGQIGTTTSTTLFLLAIPYFYYWAREGKGSDFIKGLLIGLSAAAAHHATLLFGAILFVLPVAWLAYFDHKQAYPNEPGRFVVGRIIGFFAATIVGSLIVLLPYFLALLKNPINQMPIPHQSRTNFVLEPFWAVHYWVIPVGAAMLAWPYIFIHGSTERRLRPLFLGFYLTFLFGLGETTPVPKLLLGRAFEILTFERFTFWALLMALPLVGMLGANLINKYRKRAAVLLAIAAVGTAAMAISWNVYFQLIAPSIDIKPVVSFLNRNGHDQYRYLTLGFGNSLSKVQTYTKAWSVDGEYNSARTLPEMTRYGSAQLSSSKYFGSAGMESLSAMLRHAPRYGLKYVFCRDRYYEPLLLFSGWRQIDSYNQGEITVWTTIGIPPAHEIPSNMVPPLWQGIMWGTLPFGVSVAAIFVLFRFREPQKRDRQADDSEGNQIAVETLKTAETPEHAPTGTDPLRRQRIALVTAFPPGRGDLNEYGYHLARVLNCTPGVELSVLADAIDKPEPEIEGFTVQRCWRFNAIRNVFLLPRAIRRLRPDVVWFNMGVSTLANRPVPAFLGAILPGLVSLLGYNTHVTLHAFFENVNLSDARVRFSALYRLGGKLATRILLLADGVHVLLPSYRRTLIERYGVDAGRIHVHSHGVFSSAIDLPACDSRPRVLAFGSWGTYKRLEQLIEAFSLIQKEVPDAELLVAGADHPKARGYLAALKERCRGNDSIKFLGYVSEAQMAELFRSVALAVLPYNSGAGSSGVAHLACEYGLPIIAADLPDFIEMAEWEGFAMDFYPRGDAGALARAIVRLLQSPELRAEMGKQNATAARRITFDRVVNEYLALFELTARPEVLISGDDVREQPGLA
jgi:glycosyltransferase involved in cell wall biosynthesis